MTLRRLNRLPYPPETLIRVWQGVPVYLLLMSSEHFLQSTLQAIAFLIHPENIEVKAWHFCLKATTLFYLLCLTTFLVCSTKTMSWSNRQRKNPLAGMPPQHHTHCHLLGDNFPGGGVLPCKRLMGMCRWIGSHFHHWVTIMGSHFNIVTRVGVAHFRIFWGKTDLHFFG